MAQDERANERAQQRAYLEQEFGKADAAVWALLDRAPGSFNSPAEWREQFNHARRIRDWALGGLSRLRVAEKQEACDRQSGERAS